MQKSIKTYKEHTIRERRAFHKEEPAFALFCSGRGSVS